MFHHALKPGNLFVGPAPSFEVRIADFGANLTRGATPTGDHGSDWLPWMAPEQLASGQRVGPAADVFSAALVTFFALTGKSYWRCRQTAEFDVAALRKEMSAARAPAWVRASELSVQLDPTLDGVFARALARSPGERFANVGQFADAFEGALDGHPTATEVPAPQSPEATPSGIPLPPEAMFDVLESVFPADTGASPPAEPDASPGMQARPVEAAMADADEPPPRAAAKTRWTIPIVIGAVLLLGVGGWAGLRLKRSRQPDHSLPASLDLTKTASPVQAPAPLDAAVEPPAPTASAGPSTGPLAPIEAPSLHSETSGLRVLCRPECDSVYVDGKLAPNPSEHIDLALGKHVVTVTKTGAKPQNRQVFTVAGPDQELVFTFASAAPAHRPAAPTKKPCGKFLKRCN
jgi:hypothetical protein